MKNTFKLAAIAIIFSVVYPASANAQTMTPELLWQLGRVSATGMNTDNTTLVYKVSTPVMATNSFESESFALDLSTGTVRPYGKNENLIPDSDISPDGKWKITTKDVKLEAVFGVDIYPDLGSSNAMVYNSLQHRHWDSWEDGAYSHIFIEPTDGSTEPKDIMIHEPFDCPIKPFGGSEDYTWSPDGTKIVYVAKKVQGVKYMTSTNTDLYSYDLATATTLNITSNNPGYDTHPLYSPKGALAWLSMATDGNEADKNDIKVDLNGRTTNLTAEWDGTVNSFIWNYDGTEIYFTAPVRGTVQLFSVALPGKKNALEPVKQITNGQWDITSLVKHIGKEIIAGRTDMNHANEIFSIDIRTGNMLQLKHVNDEVYSSIALSRIEARWIPTSFGKDVFTWVIYPPDFDPSKKYPTLLYCQGGPQSALSQFYSFRWNFQVMAAQGYIIVAPNRRGMPGHGVSWNAEISKNWGGENMNDYLTAIDAVAREPFVDNDRIGCVGASYGGYSAFYLAGNHSGRFKSFISHCGIFNLQSMYGNTEELFFANWEMGGAYWEKDNAAAQKSFTEFSPVNHVQKWDTPIMIIQGGKDYRVPEGQAFEAFTAAQLRGIKSRFLYFPEENHWVLKPQNGLMWQREFFKWLDETLKY
jgi:dipeptidyl aminopeptidase/acylaminoacyl peptidase